MSVNAAIVIAYRDMGDPDRAASYDAIIRHYARMMPDKIIVSHGVSDDTFTRASAINAGVRLAQHRVILQVDPDSYVTHDQARIAVESARKAPGLVVAFTDYCYLSRRATETFRPRIRSGENPPMPPYVPPSLCDEFGRGGVGNVVAFSRETWRLCRGFDERFPLWGGDDAVFAYSAEAMTGTPARRVEGNMYHLWHPRLPASDPLHPGYAAQFEIVAQYRDAAAIGPDAVRALVESRPPVD